MKKIENFVNIYPVSKTLRFKLIPVGKTRENFDNAKMLEVDKSRADNYQKAKEIIDKYYNIFITNCLNNFKFGTKPDNLKKYYKTTSDTKIDKDEKNKLINELQKSLRKEIVSAFHKNKDIIGSLFGKDLFNFILDDNRISDEDKLVIKQFDKFTTYFTGFFTNRRNAFSEEEKVGSIAYRCINENLGFHIYNIRVYNEIKDKLSTDIKTLQNEHKDRLHNMKVDDVFDIEYFNLCLTGSDINLYNSVIGGFSINENNKVKGLNEYINLYNQKNKDGKLPKFKTLYKQILSDDQNVSFRFEAISSDKEVYCIIDETIKSLESLKVFETLKDTFNSLQGNKFNNNKIYYSAKEFAVLSTKCFSDYNVINLGINIDYDKNHKIGKDIAKYEKKKNEEIKKIKYASLGQIESYIQNTNFDGSIVVKSICDNAIKLVEAVTDRISDYKKISKTKTVKDNIETIKNLLDSLLEMHRLVVCFNCYTPSDELDLMFYGGMESLSELNNIVGIYNKIRNYITKRPYKIHKIKLNFNCPYLLSGWDTSFSKNSTVLIQSQKKYYLMICIEKLTKDDLSYITGMADSSGSIYYDYIYQKQDHKNFPRMFIRSKGDRFAPSVEKYKLPIKDIIDIYDKKLFTTETKKVNEKVYKESLVKMIDYFKLGMSRHDSFKTFNFNWKPSKEYESIDQFYNDAISACYKLQPKNINLNNVIDFTTTGKIYLFEIYSKDFSNYSHGKNNLHTMYFKSLFDEANLEDVVYKLDGKAEIFYREKSIENKVTHPKNQPIDNKNINNKKKTSVFKYDLIKDKRFSEDQFEFHIPITINFKANSMLYNDAVNDSIKKCSENYVIGIDRGERNLIYINVVGEKRGLVEQISLNDIINEYNGNTYSTNYHSLLEKREKERDDAKKSWTSIENIKELKEGYISQVVHKICELVEKYDAIIVMEDLNKGFKNSRVKFEKQVYQKFEKMLIDKLNLYVNKNTDKNKFGGLLKPYQLTRPYAGNNQISFQNGFILYIAPWNTSKIDPTTGFVNLFRLNNYNTLKSKKDFISKFDGIKYNKISNLFEFTFNYDNFENGSQDYTKSWTLTSFGSRILTFRNKDKNMQFDSKEVNLTDELKTLFDGYDIKYIDCDLQSEILRMDSKEFFDKLFYYIKLILQMRNSKTGTDIDYLTSPVKNKNGNYYNSTTARENRENLPHDADSNGAYNIARKGLMIVERLKKGHDAKGLTVISNKDWLEYAQTHLPI